MPARPARTCRSAAAAGALWLQLAARLESTSPGGGASSTRWCDETLAGEGGSGYQGCQDRTVSGRLCQRWSAQSPQQHALTAESSPGKGLGDHSFCRNPAEPDDLFDGVPVTIWCYTVEPGVRFEACEPLGLPLSGYGLSTDRRVYVLGDDIAVKVVSAGEGDESPFAWVGIYGAGAAPGTNSSAVWLYTCGSQDCVGHDPAATLTFGAGGPVEAGQVGWPLPAGRYEVYSFVGDRPGGPGVYSVLEGPVVLSVVDPAVLGPTTTAVLACVPILGCVALLHCWRSAGPDQADLESQEFEGAGFAREVALRLEGGPASEDSGGSSGEEGRPGDLAPWRRGAAAQE